MEEGTAVLRPMDLSPGRVVVSWPDDRHPPGTSEGPWQVAESPIEYGQVVRVDAVDASGRTVTWVLPSTYGVAVDRDEYERQAAAAEIIARLTAARLPAIFMWEITHKGVQGQLDFLGSEVEPNLQVWAEHLGAQIHRIKRSSSTHLVVRTVMDGIPVEIWGPAPTEP
jgi:hypothetical protein